jgi:hypothetical protein
MPAASKSLQSIKTAGFLDNYKCVCSSSDCLLKINVTADYDVVTALEYYLPLGSDFA